MTLEQYLAEAARQARELIMAALPSHPKLTPPLTKAELDAQPRAVLKNFPPRCTPLLDPDEPDVIVRTVSAIQRLRKFYVPEAGGNGQFMKIFLKTAFDYRQAALDRGVKLRDVPVPNNPTWPVERELMALEQWFTTARYTIDRRMPKPVSPVSLVVILKAFKVSRATLLRGIRDKKLTDYRSSDDAPNAQHMFNPAEVARFWPPRK
jgi:hypothetical protein